jgi:hypothetical protein
MNTRTTLLLLLLAAGVVGAVFYADKWAAPTKQLEALRRNPLTFQTNQVDEVLVTAPNVSLSLKVENLFWRVGAPVSDVADTARVNDLLKSLSAAEWLEKLEPGDMSEAAWEMTGLGESAFHVQVKGAGVLVAECWVGYPSAIEGACYMSVPGIGPAKRHHYIVKTQAPALLKGPAEQWRDRTLVQMPADSISKLTVQNGISLIEVTREKPTAPWQIMKPLKARGHNDHINQLLGAATGMKITEVMPADSSKSEPPTGSLVIAVSTPVLPTPIELTIHPIAEGSQATVTTATVSHRPGTFQVTHEHLAALWMKLNDLRDNHLARVDPEKVFSLSVKSENVASVTLKKTADLWQLQRHGDWVPANGDRVSKLLTQMSEHEIIAFASDSASSLKPFGLEAPFVTVSWAEGSPEAAGALPQQEGAAPGSFSVKPELRFLQELSFGTAEDGKWYAKYADEPFIYQVSPQLINYIPRDSAPWKSLFPARFTQFALKQISLSLGTNPPVVLNYDPSTAAWSGTLTDRDITPLIDRVKADSMAARLAGLKAEDWLQDRTDAAKALQQPALTIRIVLLVDPTKPEGPTRTLEYNFAPTKPSMETPIYFGRLGSEPDVFVIMRDQLLQIATSVLKQPSTADKK